MHDHLAIYKIDHLFVDNTYMNCKLNFPSRVKSLEKMIQLIKTYPRHDVVLQLTNLGKEEIIEDSDANLNNKDKVSQLIPKIRKKIFENAKMTPR